MQEIFINFEIERQYNMAIPKFSELREPLLRQLSNNDTMQPRDFIAPLARYFRYK